MMRRVLLAVTLGLAIVFGSCEEEKPVKVDPEQLKEEARMAIKSERDKITAARGALDTARADALIDMYLTFIKNNPGDEDAPEFLYQAGSMCMGKGDFQRSIRLYNNFVNNYPNHEKRAEAMFVVAFIYDNYIDNKGMAEDWYRKVIEFYPRHELSLEASAAIRNLTLTDEELVRMFEEKNAAQEAQGN